MLNNANVIVTSPAALQEVMTRTYEFPKPIGIRYLVGRVLGNGMVLSEGDEHKQQRRTFLPAFAPRHIRDMYPIFWKKAVESLNKLLEGGKNNKEGVTEFEVGHWASRTAMDVITMAMMGKDFGAIQDQDSPLAKVFRTLLEPTRGFLVLAILKSFIPPFLVDRLPVKWNKWMDEAITTIRSTCTDMLHEAKEKLANKKLFGKDFLSIAVQYEDVAQVSEDGVVDQLTNALGAGHETISVAITWAVYMMCVHPEWQTRLREEIRTHMPSPNDLAKGSEPVAADVETQMPLLQAFISETLRRFPPVPATARWATNDSIIAGQFIPAGTRLGIPIKATNWDKRIWGPDAHEFKPERWIGPDGKVTTTGGANSNYGFLTFLQGQRACVAKGLATAEMACVLGAWVGHFEFSLVDETMLDETTIEISAGALAGKPLHGMNVRAKPVPGW
jgi:cytochrome P450